MSGTVKDTTSLPNTAATKKNEVNRAPSSKGSNYKGFVAGVFSGIAKLSVGCV